MPSLSKSTVTLARMAVATAMAACGGTPSPDAVGAADAAGPCPVGFVECAGACVDPSTNEQHCLGCVLPTPVTVPWSDFR